MVALAYKSDTSTFQNRMEIVIETKQPTFSRPPTTKKILKILGESVRHARAGYETRNNFPSWYSSNRFYIIAVYCLFLCRLGTATTFSSKSNRDKKKEELKISS